MPRYRVDISAPAIVTAKMEIDAADGDQAEAEVRAILDRLTAPDSGEYARDGVTFSYWECGDPWSDAARVEECP